MTNSLVTFNFKDNQVRTEIVDGQVWFSLADCCRALAIANSRTSVKLPEEGVGKTYTLTAGGRQEITIINEPNLYRLIFRSNKPQAQAFADWVYNDVLPSIRKTGAYGVPQVQVDMKAIGGMVKRCAAVAVREEVKRLFAPYAGEDNDNYYNIGDWDIVQYLQRWYWTRHKAILKSSEEKDEKIILLESKLRKIEKALQN